MIESPSPRKAWIETPTSAENTALRRSRLPPGRRGLKRWRRIRHTRFLWSPSPRKAWIETTANVPAYKPAIVAFPPEGVGLKRNRPVRDGLRRGRLPPGSVD